MVGEASEQYSQCNYSWAVIPVAEEKLFTFALKTVGSLIKVVESETVQYTDSHAFPVAPNNLLGPVLG